VSVFNVDRVYLLPSRFRLGSSTSCIQTLPPLDVLVNRADIRFAVQAAFAAYSVPAQSDKFYDLAGSLGFISTTLVSLVRHLPLSLFI